MTRRFQRPGRILAASAGTACGVWAISLGGCGDLVGVGSLSGSDAAAAAAGADAARADGSVDAVDASLDAAAGAVALDVAAGGDAENLPEANSCPSDSGVQWIPWSDPAVPMGAFYVGFEPMTGSDPDAGSYSYYVCRARDADDGGDIIPGVFVDSIGCFYTTDGVNQSQSSSYDVLIDPNGCLTWTTYDGGLARAVVGGQLGQDPLYVCSAPLSPRAPWWQAGYLEDVPAVGCRVPTRGGSPEDIAMGVTVATQ